MGQPQCVCIEPEDQSELENGETQLAKQLEADIRRVAEADMQRQEQQRTYMISYIYIYHMYVYICGPPTDDYIYMYMISYIYTYIIYIYGPRAHTAAVFITIAGIIQGGPSRGTARCSWRGQ